MQVRATIFQRWGSPLVTRVAAVFYRDRNAMATAIKGIASNLNPQDLKEFKGVLKKTEVIKPGAVGVNIESPKQYQLSVRLSHKKLAKAARKFKKETDIDLYENLLFPEAQMQQAGKTIPSQVLNQPQETITRNKGATLLALSKRGQEEIGEELIEDAISILRKFDQATTLESLFYKTRKIADIGGNILAIITVLFEEISLASQESFETLIKEIEERKDNKIFEIRNAIIPILKRYRELVLGYPEMSIKPFSFSVDIARKDHKYIEAKMKELVRRSGNYEPLLLFFFNRLQKARKTIPLVEGRKPSEDDKEFLDQIRCFYAPLAERLQFIFLADDLRDQWLRIADPEKYRWIVENVVEEQIGMNYDRAKEHLSEFIDRLQDVFRGSAPDGSRAAILLSLISSIFWRVKSPFSIYNKVELREGNGYSSYNNVRDILGIKIVCHSTEDILPIAGFIKQEFGVDEKDVDDYITKPRISGFQAYTIIIYHKGKPIEIQIMTERMNESNTHKRAGTWKYNLAKEFGIDIKDEKALKEFYGNFDDSMAIALNGLPINNFITLKAYWAETA